MSRFAALALLLVPTVALADKVPVAAGPPRRPMPPPPPAGPHLGAITRVATGPCSTDGGKVACPTGVKYLGEVIERFWNAQLDASPLDNPPVACDGATPGAYTFRIGFEYNEGNVHVLDAEKDQAKWPACVKTFAKQASEKWLEWYHVLQPIDPTIDVRNEYKVTITIKK